MAGSDRSETTTYHCLCSNLLLATTFKLSDLARRASPPALDKAYILPCPQPPRSLRSTSDSDSDDGDEPAEGARDLTLLLSLTASPVNESGSKNPLVVQREDGFEKRWIMRCTRCAVPVGYQLDWAQFANVGNGNPEERKGRRTDVLFVFPGAFVTTEQMMNGQRPDERLPGDAEQGED